MEEKVIVSLKKLFFALAVCVAMTFSYAVFAQYSAGAPPADTSMTSKGSFDVRPGFDTDAWIGSAVYSKATGAKLLCTMRNKNPTSENITISWDRKSLKLTVMQRSLNPVVPSSVQLSYQGVIIPSTGGTVSYLRSVKGVEIGGEDPMAALRGRKSVDLNIVGEGKAMAVKLMNIDPALIKLAECVG